MQLANVRFTDEQLFNALKGAGMQCNLASVRGISDITLDSRAANASTMFVALKGSEADGNDYVGDAISRGCKLVLCERKEVARVNAAVIEEPALKDRLPQLLTSLYVGQSSPKHIAAVTGTNGKTSVAYLYSQLALAHAPKSASLGTLGLTQAVASNDSIELHVTQQSINTTPDIISQFKILRLLGEQNIQDYCLEASSHGIEQQRLAGMPIDCAIFTNLSQDHLDYHGDMSRYGEAKRGLLHLHEVKYVVLNADDPESKHWSSNASEHAQVAFYSLNQATIPESAKHFAYASSIQATAKGMLFELHCSWGQSTVQLPLLGRFNVANYLAALTAQLMRGVAFAKLMSVTPKLKGVAGRMELFVSRSQKGSLIVDYAHTPDALAQALQAARIHTVGNLYCVFGCGGNRDKSKRALMGAAAESFSDMIVLTQDNSRDEAPESIIADIKTGLSKDASVHVEFDRKQAINWAYKTSKADDLILLAGKGHEDYLEIKQQRIAYSERDYAQHLCMQEAI
ncbi:UDP-N-acetylmuramoyl-L-alanyl-D-glutamate--2,6-diaminopimelate ligase [Glaciecola sp. XM2]|uniref:UDP-N-acetylmuramoyl-L-alanyl-D-glutamate--2, 6-diaminopimelate ligase n=1 Tax=Glaciecola sp. XM2 TaxID=1914931 RepID=UPI001BDE18B2|nr:UDP-N-acetylmuramoyl-L-alanyl-D-glutamate--2,6-diaminopimelate ligase [Glaciecola sp. XM2]MBT1450507.1 UDP-N-acetylmuramoyl-L-alanyl-D-glutamate--2,6-diaminopimelate ligase [Glaciecola sp. XM2]